MRARRFRPSIDLLDLRIVPSDTNLVAPGCTFGIPEGQQVACLGQTLDPGSGDITGTEFTGVPISVVGMPPDQYAPVGTGGSFYQ